MLPFINNNDALIHRRNSPGGKTDGTKKVSIPQQSVAILSNNQKIADS
jgi:hypothetical protein